jgi:hypothetical protein
VALVLGIQASGAVPLILDQTTIRGIQTLLIGAIFEGRVLPVAFSCFTHAGIQKSQNILEHALILTVMSCFPVESRPLLIMDRGYARVALLEKLRREGIPFLVRAKAKVIVYYQGQPRLLGRFTVKPGQMRRYQVLYQSRKKEPLDLIVFRGKGYQETWYLLVPRGFSKTTQEIVDLYAKRMSIEQGFRDWKTHLGVTRFGLSNPGPGSPSYPPAFGLLAELHNLFGLRRHGGSRESTSVCGNPQTQTPAWNHPHSLRPGHWDYPVVSSPIRFSSQTGDPENPYPFIPVSSSTGRLSLLCPKGQPKIPNAFSRFLFPPKISLATASQIFFILSNHIVSFSQPPRTTPKRRFPHFRRPLPAFLLIKVKGGKANFALDCLLTWEYFFVKNSVA